MQHNEKLNTGYSSDSAISKPTSVSEDAKARGTYHVANIGPVESFRDEYCRLRDRINARGVRAFFDRLFNSHRMISEMLSIPMEQKWSVECPNVVTTVGKNLALDTLFGGSSYSVTGPYLGLINANASAAVAGDTMASHSGWLEVGLANAPVYTGSRKTAAFSSAASGSKTLSSALAFAITSSGTVGGCFLTLGTGASSSIDNTGGVLYSAGAFTGGSKSVVNGDTLNVTYTASM